MPGDHRLWLDDHRESSTALRPLNNLPELRPTAELVAYPSSIGAFRHDRPFTGLPIFLASAPGPRENWSPGAAGAAAPALKVARGTELPSTVLSRRVVLCVSQASTTRHVVVFPRRRPALRRCAPALVSPARGREGRSPRTRLGVNPLPTTPSAPRSDSVPAWPRLRVAG